MNETMPNFFTQIPSYVMSSKELNSTDKCVYGVIYTMLNVTHKCFMSNERIGNEIGLSKKTISKTLTKLSRAGLLNIKLTYKNGTKEVDKRYITLGNIPVPQLGHNPYDDKGFPLPQSGQYNRLLNKSVYGGGEELENSLQTVINNFQKNIGLLNGKNINDLQVWTKDLPVDVINYAVEISADNNAQTYSYVNSILKRWFQQNIKTLDQAKANNVKNKRSYSTRNTNHNKRGVEDEDLVSNSLSEFAPIKLKETCPEHPDVHLIKSRIPNHEDIVCPKCVEKLIKDKDEKLAERMNDRFTVERLANDSIITDRDILNCTFDNYVVTKSEQDINKRHITAIAKKYLNKDYKGNTILSGNAGSGKTHLAYACLKYVNENSNPKQSCLFIDFNELVSKIKGNFNNTSSKWQETKLLDEIGNADLVVLDDLGSEASFRSNTSESSEWNQRFYSTY